MKSDSGEARTPQEGIRHVEQALEWLNTYAEQTGEPYLVTEAIGDLNYALDAFKTDSEEARTPQEGWTRLVDRGITWKERALAAEAERDGLREALEAIIREFREGKPRGYEGPDTYEEDDPVVIIARVAALAAARTEEPR